LFMKKSTMLSITAAYALRALVEMAGLAEGKSILGRELAKRAEIPANYLSKILLAVGNAGIIEATRGSGGGYRLLRDPHEIRLVEVVDLFDKPRVKPMCLLAGKRRCSDLEPCTAHDRWREVMAAYMKFLEATTIAEISGERNGA
jgi:Rrf2 family protein